MGRFWLGVLLLVWATPGVARAGFESDTILYGASYYHEYMPYERLEQDVRLMEEAGITLIRLGESTWSSWEPREGEFEFAWMDRIIDRLHQAGIKVILGTTTYSIPPWLYRKHPEILVTYLGGDRASYGPRQNMDIAHPTYRYYCERIIRKVIAHYRDHPAIIGYQVDNETGPYGTAGRNVQLGFVDYLKDKFGSIARINEVWGFVYWGQLVGDWDELPPRDGILNPGYKLEWERYQRKLVTDFLAWQASIVDEYRRPGQFITHNFVGGVRTNLDQPAIAKYLDVTAVNPYHSVQDDLDGESISLSGDLCRSLKQQNYLVTETNAQTIGWDSKTQYPPYDGQLRLNVYSHVAAGANLVAYWHWHSLHYGQETYWKGVLSHDLQPNRAYAEVSRIAQELKRVGPRLANVERRNQAAILYSIDSFHGIDFMRFDDRVSYMTVLHQLYRTLYRLNVGVDFVFPETEDLSRYKLIVVPPLYIADDALLRRLAEFVRGGGHLVMSFKSGFCNEFSTVRWELAPGPLRQAAGFYYQEFSNLKQPLPLAGDPFGVGDANRVSVWAELLIPETAEVVARYDHPFFGRFPAVTRNRFGQGTLVYQGTMLSDELQRAVLVQALEAAGLKGPDQELPARVGVRHGRLRSGEAVHFYLNYTGQEQQFEYPWGAGADLLSGREVTSRGSVRLAPWDLMIIVEGAGGRTIAER